MTGTMDGADEEYSELLRLWFSYSTGAGAGTGAAYAVRRGPVAMRRRRAEVRDLVVEGRILVESAEAGRVISKGIAVS